MGALAASRQLHAATEPMLARLLDLWSAARSGGAEEPFAATRLRRQLGLDRARLLLSHGGPLPPATTTFFAAIGLTLTAFPADAVPR